MTYDSQTPCRPPRHEAAHFYLKHNALATKQLTMRAINAFSKCKEQAGCSKLHTKPLRKRIEKLAEFAKAQLVCDLERADIERWLAALVLRTWGAMLSYLTNEQFTPSQLGVASFNHVATCQNIARGGILRP